MPKDMHVSIRADSPKFPAFGEGPAELQICFQPGATTLVGGNDSGKSAVIDAIRYALLTRDQEFIRVQPEDFHIDDAGNQASEIYIVCKLAELTDAEKGAFIEYLSYEDDEVVLYVIWTVDCCGSCASGRTARSPRSTRTCEPCCAINPYAGKSLGSASSGENANDE